MVLIHGHEFKEIMVRDSYNRRALQFKNSIINHLRLFGLSEDDVDIVLENICMRKAQASISWYMFDKHLFFSYYRASKFVDNLAMVAQVIEYFLDLLDDNKITKEAFLELFVEDDDIVEQRKEAREVLGVDEDSTDFEAIHQNYKMLSKKHHPDMPTGDTEMFKRINKAHKILRKELN